MNHKRREERIEANWRLFRWTSMIAAGVLLVVLLAVDVYFRFESTQLTITLLLVAVAFFALFKLEFWVHQLTRLARRRREQQHSHL